MYFCQMEKAVRDDPTFLRATYNRMTVAQQNKLVQDTRLWIVDPRVPLTEAQRLRLLERLPVGRAQGWVVKKSFRVFKEAVIISATLPLPTGLN